jgi:hypothetical protein
MPCFFIGTFYVGVSGPLIQYSKTFKKFSLGAELQPLQASPTMSFPQTCRFIEAGQGGGWVCGPEQLAATVPCTSVYSGCIAVARIPNIIQRRTQLLTML